MTLLTSKFGEPATARWQPSVNERRETHLEYTVWFVAGDGRKRWTSGTIDWVRYAAADDLRDEILSYMTPFVRQQWFRIEVCVPNRNHYGHLSPGWIKDTGLLLVTRELH